MTGSPKYLPGVSLILLGGLSVSLTGCNEAQTAQPPRPAPTVTIAKPVVKQIVEWDAYTGRLEAIDFVEVRARVSGYLKSTHFDEGQVVTKGDLLFVIDPRPFEAELSLAQATLSQSNSQLVQARAQLEEANAQKEQTQAQLGLAMAQVRRARSLKSKNVTTQDELDQLEAAYLQAKADVEASQAGISSAKAAIETAQAVIEASKAQVETAELNLDYTRIYAPVTGRISKKQVTEGNLVSGGTSTSTMLTTITSVAPIYCNFDANEQEVLKYTRLAQNGKRASSRVAKNPVFLGLVDEKGFPHKGHMDFVDNRFDVDTASMRARCIFPNKDHTLVPGMFARIRIPGSAAYNAVLIPDSAVGTDQSSQFVYVVVDNKVERRVIEPGPIVDGLRVVREGLKGDEQLIIAGLLLVRPEMEVQVKPGKIEVVEDGLPNYYEPLPPEQWISPEPDPLPTTPSPKVSSLFGKSRNAP
ncbi:efflux RND transporter periplasmic adaptor subunit [Gimesia panareensis]|uniref:efflux RND transporter periplasmic adaptor subunit n=1 Tax=Gimesia panareensis TaxID=2527978 RepID=UPI001187C2D0|nr:efflux RND transporter periplasmic adaptor subunit [Gimesia panareensis]QDU52692.1 Multidrug resistance protein MexA precursor [Gimesia panareensis]